MAGKNRTTETIIDNAAIDRLLKKGTSYRFFQALRLLDLSDCVDSERSVRIRPSLNLAFPGNDIENIEKTSDSRYLITANFFGLYGVSSPLPTFYTEDLIREKLDGKTSMRDFLDIIHAQYYPLLYKAWKKNRLWLSIDEEQTKEQTALDYLLAFVGLSHNRNENIKTLADKRSLISFAGLFSCSHRSIAGLQTLLSGLLNTKKVAVIPCVMETVNIPDNAYCLLGRQANRLGEDSILGDKVNQRNSRFDVVIGPLSKNEFSTLLPGNHLFDLLLQSIKHYCNKHYTFRIKLLIYKEERKNITLGQSWHRLGMETWLDGVNPANNGKTKGITRPQYNTVSISDNKPLDKMLLN